MSAAPALPHEVVVSYTQTGEGVPEGGKTGRLSTRDGTLDAKMFLPCANPACKKGGFPLRPHVDKAVAATKTALEVKLDCAGYTGPLRSERGPAPACRNKLEAAVEIKYGKPR